MNKLILAATSTPLSRGPTPMAGAPSQGPGLMGQMAATAGGVAIGSAVVRLLFNFTSLV